MAKTAVEDEESPREITRIVYGKHGNWTMMFDLQTVDLMIRCGVIEHVKTTSATGWETEIYRSVDGKIPHE